MTRISNIILLVILIFVSKITCCQTTQETETWKDTVYHKIYLRYPSNWVLQEEYSNQTYILSVTPKVLLKEGALTPFEIIEITPSGLSFKDFKKDLISSFSSRVKNEMQVTYKTDTIFKSCESLFFKAILYYKSDPTPATVLAINGNSKFYLVTLLSWNNNDESTLRLNSITDQILNSLKFKK